MKRSLLSACVCCFLFVSCGDALDYAKPTESVGCDGELCCERHSECQPGAYCDGFSGSCQSCVDEHEPNDLYEGREIGAATELFLGTTEGAACAGDVDWFLLDRSFSAGETTVLVEGANDIYSISSFGLLEYDPWGTPTIESSDDLLRLDRYTSAPQVFTFAPGTHLIRVFQPRDATSYRLTVDGQCNEDWECVLGTVCREDNTCQNGCRDHSECDRGTACDAVTRLCATCDDPAPYSNPMRDGEPVELQVGSPKVEGVICGDESDWFQVDMQGGDSVVFEFDGNAYDLDVTLYYADSSASQQDQLRVVDSSNSLDSREVVFAAGGATRPYWVRVYGFSGDAGAYTVQAR